MEIELSFLLEKENIWPGSQYGCWGGFPFGQWLLFGQNPGWGAATSSVLASTPNVTPDSPHTERVAHTRGIAKAVSGREKWKCFRLIVSHLECIFEAEGTGTKQPVCYVTKIQ